ncbi:Ankyrin repeats (3 copies) [Trypanosoma brucei equiperdum]|uniref:Ankyrin repeats (3 copies) n=1 Tax=Trypanosoma brucei equiperdum TaxID=630700 RepID=A0A3L6LAS5_9TRYP|nr:Ankyrin repeats (3 copies) [Trypanosoma brucei equiperdum]
MLGLTISRFDELQFAVSNGDVVAVGRLLTSYNVNMADNERRMTLLMWAVCFQQHEVAEMLIRLGASLYPRDMFSYNVIHHAAWQGDVRMMKILLCSMSTSSSSEDETSESTSSRTDTFRFRPGVRSLVDLPHPYNGRTPLMFAALKGNVEMVNFLITQAGAAIGAKDLEGNSVMDIAARIGQKAVVTLLLSKCNDDEDMCFNKARRSAEDNCENASTLQQLNEFNDLKTTLCQDWLPQSLVSLS